ncbi:MAG TPA: hypothetical protein VGS27_28405 [Candidatus Sulfotelmatobacter sp.]|nr:hypothetical protein [Candidatus Sulfotelmatobacter sp.]
MKLHSHASFETGARMLIFATLLSVSLVAVAQHKENNPPKSAPAPHASAPAHNSAPQQHSNAPANRGNSNMGHPNNGNMNRSTNNNMGRGGTNTAGHAGNGVNNNRGGMNNSAHGGNNGRSGMGNAGNTARGNNNMGRGPNANNGGRMANHTPPGRQVSLRGGGTAHIRPNGQIRSINRNGMHIEHGMHGGRTVVSTHNGVRVVSVGHRGGYVQRAYVVRGGHSYYSRTYYYHGVYRTGVYRGYYYGGRPYYGYYPAYYYHPVYYGWAYNPWPAPVYYGWGWGAQPWYGYYGPYYAPYPVYPSAAFWLTDFMIAATLQAAYEAQAADNWMSPYNLNGTLVASMNPIAPPDPKPAMSDEVKKELAEEVKAILAAEQAEAGKSGSSGASGGGQPAESKESPPALDPNFRTFVVSSDLSLVPESGDECALSQGDVITRTSETPDDDGNVSVKVVASSKSDCAVGSEGPVSTDDLQEMYNHFREQVKDGMGELAKKNGTGGLPKAPDTSTVNGDVPAPPPDKSAEKSLDEQQQTADQAEAEVKQEAASNGGGGSQ